MSAVTANLAPRRSALWRVAVSGTGIVAMIYILLYALYAFWQPQALSLYTFTDLVNNSTPLALAAAGETLVVISRGFDLSVAGVVSLTNVLMAVYPLEGPGGAFVSLLMCCAVGGLVGTINGILVARLGLQTIAATLGTMIICQGLALVILDAPGGMVADFVTYTLTDTLFGVVPIAGLFLIAVVVLWLAFRRTDTGIGLYAIGADEQSARFSGVAVSGVRITAFVGAGMLYGVAGFMLSAQTATGNPTAGTPFLMLTFAAVALGGTPLSGGHGSLVGSILGAGTLMLLQKVLFSGGVSSFYTGIFQGFVLVLAIVFGNAVARLLKKDEAR
ncbi:MAG: ABC transporter permease [Mesorhizobium sp.]